MSPSTLDAFRTLPVQRTLKARNTLFLPTALLGVVLGFPLGVVSALAGAIPLFGQIIPISAVLAVVCPVVIPLITISSMLMGSWLLVRAVVRAVIRTIIRTGTTIVALAKADARIVRTLHALLHIHEIAYMGLYGAFVLSKPSAPKSPARPPRVCLLIPDFPKPKMPTLPLTPPYSSPSYTPSRSPTLTESTDASHPLWTPVDEPTYTSLARLSNLLESLGHNELDVVANYVEILKKGRTVPASE